MARRGDGLVLRGRTWWLDFTHMGERHQARLGRSINRTVARELASVERAKALKQEAGIGRKRKDVAFDKAAEEFLKWAEANHRLNRAFEWGKFEGPNPAKQCKGNQAGRLTKEPLTRLRFLTHEEEETLLAAATEPLRTIILVGIHAGLRIKSEALTLVSSDIAFHRGQITVQAEHAKNGESRTIPMNATLKAALKRVRECSDGAGRVFVSKTGGGFRSIRTRFTTACRNANLIDVHAPHLAAHVRAEIGHRGRGTEDDSRIGRMEGNQDGPAIRSPLRSA